jgi:hypothetical protein
MSARLDIAVGSMVLIVTATFLVTAGCGSSEAEQVDPLAAEYCALCSPFPSCGRVVTATLDAACPDQTRAYYRCVSDNDCGATACESEWAARAACMAP